MADLNVGDRVWVRLRRYHPRGGTPGTIKRVEPQGRYPYLVHHTGGGWMWYATNEIEPLGDTQ